MLSLAPSCAEAEVEPATDSVVNRRRHLCSEAGVAIRVAVDQRPKPRPLGMLSKRRQQRPTLEAWPVRIRREDWVEMIEGPQRVITPAVGLRPETAQLFPFDVLLPGLNSKPDRMLVHSA